MFGYKDLESGMPRGTVTLVTELLGTFFVTLALMAGVSGWGALAAGMAFGFFCWFETTGHYNAAITLSTCVGPSRSTGLVAGIMCIASQVTGAVLAVLFAGFLQDGSAAVPDGNLTSALTDVFLTLVLLITYAKNNNGLDLGLGYFAGLSAFPSALGANASVVLGVFLGNAVLGNGLDLGMNLLWAVGAPLVAGGVLPFLDGVLSKIPRAGELLGTFFFALMAFSVGFDRSASTACFAIGASLHTVSNMFKGTYNPAVTLALWAKGGFDLSVVADPLIDITAQVAGTALAVLAASALGAPAAVPDAADLGPAAVIECLFALVFVLTYLSATTTLTRGLAYFAVTAAFASSFNTALVLGGYLMGLAGIGGGDGGALGLTSLIAPLVAGLAAGVLHKFGQDPTIAYRKFNELFGTLLLFLFVGATASNRLALGGALVTLHTICAGGLFNPALTLAQSGVDPVSFVLQISGAVVGGLAATYAGMADGAATSAGGLSDGGASLVAELLLAAILVKTYDRNGIDHVSTGLSYFGLLAALGGAAGSIANPAVVLGNWVGGGLLGGGFDFSVDALLGLVGHVAAPMLGAALSNALFALPHKLMLDKIGLSADEFFCSFLAVLASSGVACSGTDSTALAYGLVLMTIYNVASTSVDIFPVVSAYRELVVSAPLSSAAKFGRKAAAQVLGAVVAALAAKWLFSGAADSAEDAPLARRLGLDLPPGLLNGILLGLVFCWGLDACKNTLHLGLTFFVAASVFAGVDINGANSVAKALVGMIMGDGVDFATDLTWWVALLAPIVGGILAGRPTRLLLGK